MNQEYDVQLSFEELVHACDNDRQWVVSLIEENAISISGEPHLATFSGYQLARVRRARRLHHGPAFVCRSRIGLAHSAAWVIVLDGPTHLGAFAVAQDGKALGPVL